MIFIGVDVGTTSMKAVAVRNDGSEARSCRYAYTQRAAATEGSYLDVGEIVSGLRRLMASLLKADSRNTPTAVSVSVLGEAICATGGEGELANEQLLLPMDYRGLALYKGFVDKFGIDAIEELTGHPIHPMFSISKILWLQSVASSSHQPSGFIDALSLVNKLLTGKVLTEPSIAARTQLYDIRTKAWSSRILRQLGLSEASLPTIGKRGDFVGYLRTDLLPDDLRRDIPVFLGGFDQACAALGNGVIDIHSALDNVGTTICVGTPQLGYRPDLRLQELGFQWTPSVSNPEGMFLNGGSLSGGIVLDWCARFLDPTQKFGDAVNYWLSQAPEKPSSLTFLPYLTGASAPYPDPEARAIIAGITIDSCAADLFSAALDSVTFESRLVLEKVEERLGQVQEVVVSGSPRRSARWLKKKANVYGRTVATTAVAEASAYGAAMIAALGHDTKIQVRDLVANWCRKTGKYEPSGLAEEYDDKFRRYEELRKQRYSVLL